MAAGKYVPSTNITMPVFNRHDQTLKTIFALRRNTGAKIILTVVDNGSKEALRNELIRLHKEKVIDNLFILEKNYGISCACNVGWQLVDASFFMKLDNDMLVLSGTWLEDVFSMWGRYKYSTVFGPVWNSDATNLKVDTPCGTMWMMPASLSGAAFLVSKKVNEQIGYFSEDYGLYGEEDADYCMRCLHAGIRKYTFEASKMFADAGGNDDYKSINFSKVDMHNRNVGFGRGEGIFALNLFLYKHGLRDLKVRRRYVIDSVDGNHVKISEDQDYLKYLDALSECCDLFNACGREPDSELTEKIKKILIAA